MKLLESYLTYLNEQSSISKVGSWAGKHATSGAKVSGMWGIFYIPATILAWKAANTMFSQAVRKCGGIKKSTPGFKVCVAKERIKALEQKIVVAKKILSGCNKSKNPEICKEKFEVEIEKAKNRILINQNKIKEVLGEQQNLQEIVPLLVGAAGTVGGVAVAIAAGMLVDKAIFATNRSVQALFNQAVRKCGVYKEGPERELCISKFKLVALTKKLSELNGLTTKCNKDKNPEKCKEKVKKHIEKTIRDIQIQKDNIIAYKKEIETKKREEQLRAAMKAQSSK